MAIREESTLVKFKMEGPAQYSIDGSIQTNGVNYWETFAPVASWPTIWLILIMAIVNSWHIRQIDYVNAHLASSPESA
jgi:hypothetical protein